MERTRRHNHQNHRNRKKPCTQNALLESNLSGKLYPDLVTDPHKSGMVDPGPDPLQREKLVPDPDPHQRKKMEALEGHFWSIGGSKSGKSEW